MPNNDVRPIAMGVGAIRMGDTGDGVPGTNLTELPLPTKSSVAFNFQDPKEVKIEVEGTDEPFYVEMVKDSTDYIEFSIPTPSNEVVKLMCGGKIDAGTEQSPKNVWERLTNFPDINKTFQFETPPKQGKKVIYTITKGRVAAKFSQAPGKEQPELLLVRVYIQAAITTAGEVKTAFSREIVTVTEQ